MTDSETSAEPNTSTHSKSEADSKRATSKGDKPIDDTGAQGKDAAAKVKDTAEAKARAAAGDEAGDPADSKAEAGASAAEGASAGDEPADLGEDVTLTAKEYHELTEERDEYKDKFIRKVAELDNVIRRSAKEKSDLAKFGNEGFIKELLPVLDSFDQALPDDSADGKAGDSGEDFAAGIALVKKKLLDVFAKNGVEVVDDKGKPFDPNRHQAIQKVEDAKVEVETVSEQYQKGYTLNGRLVRPAMVVVAVPTKK